MTKQRGPGRRPSRAVAVCALIISLATFALYLPSLGNGLVNWDDWAYVLENERIRSFGLEFLRWAFTSVFLSNWHPLSLVSHALDYAVWGLDSFGHHLTNNILHAVDTFLVAVVAARLAGCKAGPDKGRRALVTASVAALLFGLHPLHVESVTWVSERKDVLSALFFLLSALFYLRHARVNSGVAAPYAASLSFFALALMSKPMAITLPAVLLIMDFYPLERYSIRPPWKGLGRALVEKAPYLALSALSAFLTLRAQQKAIVPLEWHTPMERAAVALRAVSMYLYKMLLPLKLVPFYPLPPKDELFGVWFIVSIAVFAAITVFCVSMLRRKKAFAAAWLYYLVTLSPVIGIIQVGEQAAADRYTYIPSIGPFILAGAGAALLIEKAGKKGVKVTLAAFGVILALLSYRTFTQQSVWKDSVTLWSHEIRYYPDSAPIAYYDRGLAYDRMGDYGNAAADYAAAIALDPMDGSAYLNRGIIHAKLGRPWQALLDFNRALRARPPRDGFAAMHLNRGIVYLGLGRLDEAIEDFTEAIRLDPSNADYFVNRGVAFARLGRLGEAVEDFRTAIRLNPGDPKAYHNLGTAYGATGEAGKASFYLKKAEELGYMRPSH
ncbi:MAG: tetratricopeptide repeat protein [Deltaproteobacteria bacterium]|nr:tetratricopeptide repeat protein [Deltaproteobacteria bacterium]